MRCKRLLQKKKKILLTRTKLAQIIHIKLGNILTDLSGKPQCRFAVDGRFDPELTEYGDIALAKSNQSNALL